MDEVSMSYLFSFSRYQTECFIEFLFRQLMASWSLRLIFDHPLKQWPTGRKKREGQKYKNLNISGTKSFLDEIKSIFHSFWRAIIWWNNKNLMKIADTSCKHSILLYIWQGSENAFVICYSLFGKNEDANKTDSVGNADLLVLKSKCNYHIL